MSTRFLIHTETIDTGGWCWWAEMIEAETRYTAAAPRLTALHDLVRESCRIEQWDTPVFTYCDCTERWWR